MKPFSQMTRSTQRMIVGSLIGQTARLTLRDGGEYFIEVIGLATPTGEPNRFQSRLIARSYFSGDMLVTNLAEIAELAPKERPITDPKHPDYEDPGRKVTPLVARAGWPKTPTRSSDPWQQP